MKIYRMQCCMIIFYIIVVFMEGGETRTIGRHTFYNATKLTRVPFMTFVDINNPVSAIQALNSSLKADNPLFKDQMVYETKMCLLKFPLDPILCRGV